MNDRIKIVHYDRRPSAGLAVTESFGIGNSRKANAFHRSFPEYRPTPLVSLGSLAGELGIGSLLVKDESFRFGLNSFKVLGGSYAIGTYIARRLGMDIGALDFGTMTSAEIRERLGDVTFVTATDGNHGRGVAWAAKRLKQNPRLAQMRSQIGLTSSSRVLCISTEGDTDRENYRKILLQT